MNGTSFAHEWISERMNYFDNEPIYLNMILITISFYDTYNDISYFSQE